MRAIVLSAGQGRRLLPLTTEVPKCLLAVDADRPVLELQLRALERCGIRQVTVMVGFGAEKVERFLAIRSFGDIEIRTRYNPFFATSNNLVTCWLAIPEMTEDFVLLNGDTLFETEVLRRLLAAPQAPVTLTIDQKADYDEDDMKVTLNGGRRLIAVGKTLVAPMVHGESIGLMRFWGRGVVAFRTALNAAIREPEALHHWYLSVINSMASSVAVDTVSIQGHWWTEIDTPEDLAQVRSHFTHEPTRLALPRSPSSIGDS
jgi:choline kinase